MAGLTVARTRAARTAGARTARSPHRRRQMYAAWGFAAPFGVLFAVFLAGPVIGSLMMSLTDMRSADLRNPFAVNFVGLANFGKLAGDQIFGQAALNTAYFVGVGVPLTMVVALAAAVALDRGIDRFRMAFRVGYYLPVVTSIVAISVIWRFLLQPDNGLVNTVLSWVGVAGPDWLASTTWAMPSLIVMACWRNFGNLMVIFLAGLQAVPRGLLEAAAVDGATAIERFRYVTVPMLRPTLLFGAVITGIGYLQFFEEPLVMTGGGPLNRTLSVSYDIYNQFGFGNYGYAAAMSYVLFLAIVLLTLFQFKLLGRGVR
ncbi:carbohydrate ABC transporter permease [Fodinicola acaciae]|uniref:carbohydrate ABC transporter permease n=1 Tax=Fodinicola acaciae TaxID=2681555 RepID=UPI0013D75F52|nr:sugar ABC transporter permease [Fodinicola acaciae]